MFTHVAYSVDYNDILFTVRSDNPSFAGDVVNWISGSNRLRGQTVASPRFDAGMTITSTRAMFVQVGLPRNIAERQGLIFRNFVATGSSSPTPKRADTLTTARSSTCHTSCSTFGSSMRAA